MRRNAELHSGELPFHQMVLEAWEGRYWQASEVIAALIGFTLEEWIGADAAKAPKELIKMIHEATLEAAKQRVEQAKQHFLQRKPKQREEALALSRTKRAFHYPKLFQLVSDHEWEVQCPSCTGRAFMAGIEYEEEVVDSQPGEGGWEEEVQTYYGAEEFRCPTCELHLDSRQEIEAVDLDPDYSKIETRTRDYEPDYGNC